MLEASGKTFFFSQLRETAPHFSFPPLVVAIMYLKCLELQQPGCHQPEEEANTEKLNQGPDGRNLEAAQSLNSRSREILKKKKICFLVKPLIQESPLFEAESNLTDTDIYYIDFIFFFAFKFFTYKNTHTQSSRHNFDFKCYFPATGNSQIYISIYFPR